MYKNPGVSKAPAAPPRAPSSPGPPFAHKLSFVSQNRLKTTISRKWRQACTRRQFQLATLPSAGRKLAARVPVPAPPSVPRTQLRPARTICRPAPCRQPANGASSSQRRIARIGADRARRRHSMSRRGPSRALCLPAPPPQAPPSPYRARSRASHPPRRSSTTSDCCKGTRNRAFASICLLRSDARGRQNATRTFVVGGKHNLLPLRRL